MNRISLSSAALALTVGLAGCAGMPFLPQRQGPASGPDLPPAPAAHPALSLALVASANTKSAVNFGHKVLAGSKADKWIKDDLKFFQRNFGKVVHATSLAEAWASGADLVAALDIYEQGATGCKYDETAVFLAPGDKEIARIRASTDVPFQGPFSIGKALKKCRSEVQAQLENGIRSSQALLDFARRKTHVAAPAPESAAAASAFQPPTVSSAAAEPQPATQPGAAIIAPPAAAPEPAAAASATAPPPAAGLPLDILRPGFSTKPDASAFALVVGIERYARIPQANFAEQDAQAMIEYLLAMGFPRRNIIQLFGAEASHDALKEYLESWLPKNVRSDSRVFFYFSGHGAADLATGESYLMPWDGDPHLLQDTAYPAKRLYERLAALPAKTVIAATEADFSGAGGGAVPSGRVSAFTAASAEQLTSALEDKGHGVFTYYFLKGLGGEARDASGRVTAQGLLDYIRPKVQDEARRRNRYQEPMLSGPKDQEIFRF